MNEIGRVVGNDGVIRRQASTCYGGHLLVVELEHPSTTKAGKVRVWFTKIGVPVVIVGEREREL